MVHLNALGWINLRSGKSAFHIFVLAVLHFVNDQDQDLAYVKIDKLTEIAAERFS